MLGRTPYSNVGLPAKIGQLIGDSFMVVVGVSDTMCARCASLINHLDKLETDARTVKKTLMGYIAAKYQLNHKGIRSCYNFFNLMSYFNAIVIITAVLILFFQKYVPK